MRCLLCVYIVCIYAANNKQFAIMPYCTRMPISMPKLEVPCRAVKTDIWMSVGTDQVYYRYIVVRMKSFFELQKIKECKSHIIRSCLR